VCITIGISFIIISKPVSRWRLKSLMSNLIIGGLTLKILNGRYLESDLFRIIKLIPDVIHTKIHTYVKFEVSIFNETKITQKIETHKPF
jgi:hypothetical protein